MHETDLCCMCFLYMQLESWNCWSAAPYWHFREEAAEVWTLKIHMSKENLKSVTYIGVAEVLKVRNVSIVLNIPFYYTYLQLTRKK